MTSDVLIQELDVVALLADAPEHNLSRGQVGTVVHNLDKDTVLVEFSDKAGETYAITPIPKTLLLPLLHKAQRRMFGNTFSNSQ